MMVLRFSMQEEDIIEHTKGKRICLHFGMQGENAIELSIVKYDLRTLSVNL